MSEKYAYLVSKFLILGLQLFFLLAKFVLISIGPQFAYDGAFLVLEISTRLVVHVTITQLFLHLCEFFLVIVLSDRLTKA